MTGLWTGALEDELDAAQAGDPMSGDMVNALYKICVELGVRMGSQIMTKRRACELVEKYKKTLTLNPKAV